MTSESTFIEMMREIATSAEARGLDDDAAVLSVGNELLVVTHDMMAEGVHWSTAADPADVAWKLVASNLSDLAAKGAKPIGVLLGYTLGNDEWDRRFQGGLAEAVQMLKVPLLGGDTIGVQDSHAARSIGMTALGLATHKPVPARSGAKVGDIVYVTGFIGDALAGFELDKTEEEGSLDLLAAFWWPKPLVGEGQALAPHVNAMMDISDGLLLDAKRMADASGVAMMIDLSRVPLSADYIAQKGDGLDGRIQAASWGEDYQLLFTAPASTPIPVAATAIGRVSEGAGLALFDGADRVPLPPSLGYQHS